MRPFIVIPTKNDREDSAVHTHTHTHTRAPIGMQQRKREEILQISIQMTGMIVEAIFPWHLEPLLISFRGGQ